MRTMFTKRGFTTNFPVDFLKELDQLATEVGAQKNDLIVEAVRFWKKRRNQYRLESAYKALNEGDKKELAAIADEGLADWVE